MGANMRKYHIHNSFFLTIAISVLGPFSLQAQDKDVPRLVAALLGDTPLIEDLRELTDEIGGRPTGSGQNLNSVEWALNKFQQAGVSARKEAFKMPALWLENSCSAKISRDVTFSPRVAAMPFSTATPKAGLTAPLVDGGTGTRGDFDRLGDAAHDAFVLIETEELKDLGGMFKEYADAVGIEKRAFAADVAGVVYVGSRSRNVLYRHNASRQSKNRHPMLVMERDGGLRAMRLLRAGKKLDLTAWIDINSGGPYDSYNVIGEIKGSEKPEEIVLIGAHLDSWGLGTGALDDGCNVALVIDLARQIKRLSLKPRRTIRFALWNGEEQGLIGSWAYTKSHLSEMDHHVMASSFDLGSGKILGFFTNGRSDLLPRLDEVLRPVGGLGPFVNINEPIVGTDNYDFMLQGVANLVANQAPATYGPNYHARSDTYDKVDLNQLRLNAAIAAAVTYGFAQMHDALKRQTREEVEYLVKNSSLGQQMLMFDLYEPWQNGSRAWSK
jgi:hypothetical protein